MLPANCLAHLTSLCQCARCAPNREDHKRALVQITEYERLALAVERLSREVGALAAKSPAPFKTALWTLSCDLVQVARRAAPELCGAPEEGRPGTVCPTCHRACLVRLDPQDAEDAPRAAGMTHRCAACGSQCGGVQ